MCKCLSISKSAFYYWDSRFISKKAEDSEESRLIKDTFKKYRGDYGSPRLEIELHKIGYRKSRSTIARNMNKQGLKVNRKRKFRTTTDSNHGFEIAPNLLDRKFSAESIGTKWVSDITYIRVAHKWAYLTVIIDLADRMVVGWSLSATMSAKSTVIRAFKRALIFRKPEDGLIFHSDRGVQYACNEFKSLINRHNVRQSMSRKGNCWDNAVAESFFKTIKVESIYKYQFKNLSEAYSVIFEYIRGWYNTSRIHSALGNITPLQAFINKSKYLYAA
jgi:transposase InsO family protein